MQGYLRSFEIFELTKEIFTKRQQEIVDREKAKALDISKVRDRDLEDAGVSKREFD